MDFLGNFFGCSIEETGDTRVPRAPQVPKGSRGQARPRERNVPISRSTSMDRDRSRNMMPPVCSSSPQYNMQGDYSRHMAPQAGPYPPWGRPLVYIPPPSLNENRYIYARDPRYENYPPPQTGSYPPQDLTVWGGMAPYSQGGGYGDYLPGHYVSAEYPNDRQEGYQPASASHGNSHYYPPPPSAHFRAPAHSEPHIDGVPLGWVQNRRSQAHYPWARGASPQPSLSPNPANHLITDCVSRTRPDVAYLRQQQAYPANFGVSQEQSRENIYVSSTPKRDPLSADFGNLLVNKPSGPPPQPEQSVETTTAADCAVVENGPVAKLGSVNRNVDGTEEQTARSVNRMYSHLGSSYQSNTTGPLGMAKAKENMCFSDYNQTQMSSTPRSFSSAPRPNESIPAASARATESYSRNKNVDHETKACAENVESKSQIETETENKDTSRAQTAPATETECFSEEILQREEEADREDPLLLTRGNSPLVRPDITPRSPKAACAKSGIVRGLIEKYQAGDKDQQVRLESSERGERASALKWVSLVRRKPTSSRIARSLTTSDVPAGEALLEGLQIREITERHCAIFEEAEANLCSTNVVPQTSSKVPYYHRTSRKSAIIKALPDSVIAIVEADSFDKGTARLLTKKEVRDKFGFTAEKKIKGSPLEISPVWRRKSLTLKFEDILKLIRHEIQQRDYSTNYPTAR